MKIGPSKKRIKSFCRNFKEKNKEKIKRDSLTFSEKFHKRYIFSEKFHKKSLRYFRIILRISPSKKEIYFLENMDSQK
jgi:hypothetical protein